MYNKLKNKYLKAVLCFVLVSSGFNFGFSQTVSYQVSAKSNVQITGTSSMHDWQMDAVVENCKIEVNTSSKEKGLELVGVEFLLPSVMLKSEHRKMDAIAQKALKSSEYPNIQFKSNSLQSIVINQDGEPTKVKGILEIAGVKKEIEFSVTTKLEDLSGRLFQFSFPINMEDYAVEPPSFMFGAVTTGSDVLASFELYFNKLNQ